MPAKRGNFTVLHSTDTCKSNATELCLRSKSILETGLKLNRSNIPIISLKPANW